MKVDNRSLARELASWKRNILKHWDNVRIIESKHPDISKDFVNLGESYQAEVVLDLGGLPSSDIGVELVIPQYNGNSGKDIYTKAFDIVESNNQHTVYRVDITPDRPGVFNYGIRIFANHEELPHRQDFALVKWV
jgi:phosphorylase/glycogen(starch) synthase